MPKGIRKNKVAAELEEQIVGDGSVATLETKAVDNPVQLEKDSSYADGEYKITVVKDYDGKVDDFYLSKKDPRYEYRWLADNAQNLSRRTGNMLFQGEGWQLCEREHLKRIGIEDKFLSPDGLYRRGDLILSFIPKELLKQKMDFKAKKAQDQNSQIERLLKEGDEGGGVFGAGGLHDTMKGLQTQKQLGIK